MSGTRFGRLEADSLRKTEQAIFTEVTNVNIIDVDDVRGLIGHDYFRSSPAASADLALLLNGAGGPGSPGRPLEHVNLNFWRLAPGYPQAAD